MILPSIIVCASLVIYFFVFFVFAQKTAAATLYFLPSAGEAVDEDSLVVEVRLDTEGETVNVLEGAVVYPAGNVEILDISDGGSLLSLWPQKPIAKDGRIDFIGGAPGGYKGDGKLFSIIFKPKETSSLSKITLTWDAASKILLNDGLGTEAAKRFLAGNYEVFPIGKEAVKVVSADHPDQNSWYPSGILTLRWEVKPEFLYSYVLSQDPLAEPDGEAEAIFKEGVEYAGLADGIYYFHLKTKSPTGSWSRKSTFRAMIDAAPPEITEAAVARDPGIFNGRYFLSFAVRDAVSGVVEVSVAEGDEEGGSVWREAVSPHLLKDQKRISEIKIKARDKAGNETVYTIPAEKVRLTKGFIIWFLAVVVFIILILGWRARAKFFIVMAAIWIFAGLAPSATLAQTRPSASLFFAVPTGTFARGENFNVAARLSSAEETINAAEGVINFPKDILEVTSITRAGSVFTLWPQEPVFSNEEGAVHFAGGLPNPGFKGQSAAVFIITFRGKAAGEATVYFSSGTVLANDGFGSDITKTLGSARYVIAGQGAAPAVPPATKLVLPPPPIIFSSTHPDSSQWYAAREARFYWDLPAGVEAVRLLVGQIPQAAPSVSYAPPVSTKSIANLTDGVWYFHAQFRNADGWGSASHFRFQIDSTKPGYFNITQVKRRGTSQERALFSFDASDSGSGIDHYSVQVDGGAAEIWADDGSHLYETPVLKSGQHILKALAVDRAGNFLEATKEFIIEAAPPPPPPPPPAELTIAAQPSPFSLFDSRIVLAALIFLTAIFGFLIWLVRRRHASFKKIIKKGAQESEEGLHKIFDALKENFSDKIKLLNEDEDKRRATDTNEKIVKQVKKDLTNLEKVARKKIRDVFKDG